MKRRVVFSESDSDENDAFNENVPARTSGRPSARKVPKTSNGKSNEPKVQSDILDLLQKAKAKEDKKKAKSKGTLDVFFKANPNPVNAAPKQKEVSVDDFFASSSKSKQQSHSAPSPTKKEESTKRTLTPTKNSETASNAEKPKKESPHSAIVKPKNPQLIKGSPTPPKHAKASPDSKKSQTQSTGPKGHDLEGISQQSTTKQSHNPVYSPKHDPVKSASPITTPKKSPNVKQSTPHVATPESKTATTPQSARKPFWAYTAREGPRNLGGKPIPKGSPTCLQGLTFLITGILESIDRPDAHALIERCGGKVMKTLGKKTNYLVVGRDPGESKLAKAQTLNTKQLDEDEFFDLIRTLSREDDSKSTDVKQQPEESPKTSQSPKKSPAKKSPKKAPSVLADDSCSLTAKPMVVGAHPEPPSGVSVKMGDSLWVDKYKPTTRRNLIGQNGPCSPANRLFNWLSDWHQQLSAGSKARAYSSAPPWATGSGDDGKWARAALLSGPPGIGKTTSVTVICNELGFSMCELNASDARSKKCLQDRISNSVKTANLASMANATASQLSTQRHVLVMDEVDGMAGNEDRGGMQELINMIKTSRIPIICMCNDRQSAKIRSLANYCYDLRFHRPRVEQIKAALMSIACKEGINVSPVLLNNIIESSNHDIRQAVNSLQMYAAGYSADSSEASDDSGRLKDVRLNAFEAIRKVFAGDHDGTSSINASLDLFFTDYSLMPLFVEENYLSVRHRPGEYSPQQTLQLLAEVSRDIATGDIVSHSIRNVGTGSWSLLPIQGIFSCVRPGRMLRGSLPGGGPGGGVSFPSWFGKNSNQQRMRRVCGDLATHLILTTHGGSANVRNLVLDYFPVLADKLTKPLKEGDTNNVLNALLHYNLQREDFDSILELTTWSNMTNRMLGIDSKVKASLTRSLNKTTHLLPYATVGPIKSKGKRSVEVEDVFTTPDLEDDDRTAQPTADSPSQSSEDESSLTDAMVTVKRKTTADPPDSKPAKKPKNKSGTSKSEGRGRGKTKK